MLSLNGLDPYNLERFVQAQDEVLGQIKTELETGKKTGCWMWFTFPQISGLGSSEQDSKYSIGSMHEAQAYLAHPLLSKRLDQWTRAIVEIQGKSLEEIFGYPDKLKFHSSMTLFARASNHSAVFSVALLKYCAGKFDPLTDARLAMLPK